MLIDDFEFEAIDRLTSHEKWCKWAFPLLEGREFQFGNHHRLCCQTVDRVLSGEIKRLNVNMPPGHGKTELFTIMLSARIYALRSWARIMHLSYSDGLVSKNSRRIKRLIEHEEFKKSYPNISLSKNSKATNHWETTTGGEFHASPTGGQVTGFRAGWDGHPFDGGILLDDMMKPMDARSVTIRESVNGLLTDTVSSRLAHDDTWVISVQQRLDKDDTSAYLMRGGVGDHWWTLVLPAIGDGSPPKHYREYSHAKIIEYDESDVPSGALWPQRFGLERLTNLQNARDSETDSDLPKGMRAFAAQYQQSPISEEASLMDRSWINYYKEPPTYLINGEIRVDTASTASKNNDFTGVVTTGIDEKNPNDMYVVDCQRYKLEPMQMFEAVAEYVKRQVDLSGQKWQINVVKIENADQGPSLASYLRQVLPEMGIRVRIDLVLGRVKQMNKTTKKIETIAKNKFERAQYVMPWIQQGRLWLPSCKTKYTDSQFASILADELSTFSLDDSHGNDDLLDPTVLALIDRFHKERKGSSYAGHGDIR